MERNQFTFYESFFKAISRIRKKQARADAYDALCAYALYGREPEMEVRTVEQSICGAYAAGG